MKTIRVTFRPGCGLYAAMVLIKAFNPRVTIVGNSTFMCVVDVMHLDRIKALYNDVDVLEVKFYENDVETIRGLFSDDD